MEYLHIISVLVIGYIFLFIMAKLLGKTQITQITPFDFISAIVLGELVGNALYDQETGIPEIFFAVAVWGILIYATEILTQKAIISRFQFVWVPEPLYRLRAL